MNLGDRGCSEPWSGHYIPTSVTEQDFVFKKKEKKKLDLQVDRKSHFFGTERNKNNSSWIVHYLLGGVRINDARVLVYTYVVYFIKGNEQNKGPAYSKRDFVFRKA